MTRMTKEEIAELRLCADVFGATSIEQGRLERLLDERKEMEALLREAAPELRAGLTRAGHKLADEIESFLRPGAEAGK